MSNINISPSEDGPEVKFDKDSKTFKIVGNSYPENCEKIYEPVKRFIEHYGEQGYKTLNLEFHFNLINSTSTVYVAQIIVGAATLTDKGVKVSVKWYYDKYDEELLDLGEKLSTISKIPFEYIPVEDED